MDMLYGSLQKCPKFIRRGIPDICHLDHLHVGGEKIGTWRNIIFQHLTDVKKSENFSTCRGISDFSTQQMWRYVKICQIWRNFTFLYMTDVKKYEIYPVFCCKICFVAICAVFMKSVLALLTHFCVENN